ncbi:PRC-barrel domain-containing protein [Xanthobacter tagetidis]|nr:PRC-barrel domain-containing protein [Xanthobacter tagetidis]MBB6308490.1 sporulation protein YlmC with PRC-barrel domain [Xanthobacter tagetidis]
MTGFTFEQKSVSAKAKYHSEPRIFGCSMSSQRAVKLVHPRRILSRHHDICPRTNQSEDDMKKIKLLTVAAASLLASAAIAQQTAPTTTPGSSTMPPAATAAPPATFIGMQTADQIMASDLIGMSVRGAGDESIGEINDVVLARDGRVIGAVIGVGGFLGIGEKSVAVPFQMVEMVRGPNTTDHVVIRKTKDELKAAPEFKEREAPSATNTTRTPAQPAPAAR